MTQQDDYIILHNQLTGEPVKYSKNDAEEVCFVYKRIFEEFKNGKIIRMKRWLVYQGDKQGMNNFLTDLKDQGYFKQIPDYDKNPPYTPYYFIKSFPEEQKWEIGMFSMFNMYKAKDGAVVIND